MSESIPVVDLRVATGGQVVEALASRSCAFVVGHGVAAELRTRLVEASRAFFALPESEKTAVLWPGDGLWYGWQPVYAGRPELTGETVPNLLERYEINLDRPSAPDATPAEWAASFALWPDAPDGFAEVWTEYYLVLRALATRVVAMIVEGLGLPVDQLPAWTDEQYANLVVNHYLAQPEPPADEQTRIGVHTDQGGLTLLWADEAPGGLEVRFPGDEHFTAVQIPPDAFLVQVGDLLERWSAGRIRANVHRVVNPPRDVATTAARFAVAYFHHPALDTVVDSVVAGEHVLWRERRYRETADLMQ
jgi:isopenicillin N synthase-like dioxygenase